MRHPNKQNSGTPVIGHRAQQKARRVEAFRAARGMSRIDYQLWKRAQRFMRATGTAP